MYNEVLGTVNSNGRPDKYKRKINIRNCVGLQRIVANDSSTKYSEFYLVNNNILFETKIEVGSVFSEEAMQMTFILLTSILSDSV